MDAPKALSGVVTEFHHVAIVVPEIAAVRAFWEGGLGLAAGEPEHVPEQGVNVLVLEVGGRRIELVEPAGEDSPVLSFLARRGPGLHHLAFRVENVDAAIARLRERGLRLIDETPKAGAHGARVVFVHPKTTNGVLVELVEERTGGHP